VVTRRRWLGAVVLGGLIAAGCGIPTQQQPSTISPDRVPLGLASGTLPETPTTQPNLKSEAEVTIYLLQLPAETLVARTRVVQIPAPLKSILTSLLAGPEVAEAANGITTAIPTGVQLLSVTTQGSMVTVNFNSAFGTITGSATELAVAQVVATVAAQNGSKTGVTFEVDSLPISVPIASGAQVPGPVYILQFIKSPT
jgi:spore germination protein GerM